MAKKQYGAYSEYTAGDLSFVIAKLALMLEQQFPNCSATWTHKAPNKNIINVGFVSWKLFSDVPPINNKE